MKELKNWDNKTWLSSSIYISSFNSFLLKKKKLNKHSKILDIGCGRGKIIGYFSRKFKLTNKPIGIDPVSHKDVDKSINFKNEDVWETEPSPAMPEYCKVKGDAVASYRKYYIMEKRRFATWKSPATTPDWYVEGVNNLKEKECQSQCETI